MTYSYGNTLLKLEDVNLQFGNKKILENINLEIKDVQTPGSCIGQIVTLLGPSGIGKSQLFKIIAGLQAPTSGKVEIEGKPVEIGQVGMVLQNYPLFQHRTILSNLNLVSNDKAKIEELLEEFSLTEHKKKFPFQLSGGQRQRVAIIQQFLSSDKFILLDEPISGLDPLATQKLIKVIRKVANLNEENTIIISSHILEPSIAISDTVIMLGKPDKDSPATIILNDNLIEKGLAWNENIYSSPLFHSYCNEIRNKF